RAPKTLAILNADRLHRLERGDHLGGTDREPGRAKHAREMQDVIGEAPVDRAREVGHDPSSAASSRASAINCAAISGVTAPMSSWYLRSAPSVLETVSGSSTIRSSATRASPQSRLP